MKMSMIRAGPDVKFLATIPAVGVANDPKILQDAKGPVHRRWGRCGVDRPAPVDELAARHVPVGGAKDVEEQATLWRPAKSARTELVADLGAGNRVDCRGASLA